MSDILSKMFFFQAEDGIRDVERSRGLGDVYKRQTVTLTFGQGHPMSHNFEGLSTGYLLAKFHNSTSNK